MGKAAAHGTAICAGMSVSGDFSMICADKNGCVRRVSPERDSHRVIDMENARIALVDRDELYHPEFIVALAKQGCDLAVTSAFSLERHDRMVLGSRSIEQVALAVCSPRMAFVCQPPVGHQRWAEMYSESVDEPCKTTLDIAALRKKNFYDRLDYDLLLGRYV